MTAHKPSPLMPKLRFPEFRDGPTWDLLTLSSASDVNPSNEGLPELFIYIDLESVKSSMLIERKEITRDAAPSRAQRLLSRKDIIYQTVRPYQRNNLFFDINDGYEYVASTGYAQLRAYECPGFLYHLLHTDSFVNSVLTRCTDSNYPAINPSNLASIPVALPRKPEQQKIADCLGSLDDLIAAEGRKLAALRQHKRGLLQNLLPQEGNAQPAVRFSQYRDSEAWNVTRLGDIADYENGKAYEKDIVDNGRFVVVNARFISTDGAIRKYTNETYCIAQTSDVLMVLSDLPSAKALARCFLVDADNTYAVNQRVAKLRPRSVDSRFLLYALDQHPWLMSFSDGINQTHLSKGSVLDCPVAVPRDDGEQKLTGECLGAVDSRVAAQEAKLVALTRHKSGLLQQLFPSPEEESR